MNHTLTVKHRAAKPVKGPRVLHGDSLLNDPARNRGTAFTAEQRRRYGLEGLLPCSVESLDRQLERVLRHLEVKATDLEHYIYLIGLADRNKTLFYRTLMSDPGL
jgi:malate dehydrogenase (oxaloacetate-decarboxylating)(NADP+)